MSWFVLAGLLLASVCLSEGAGTTTAAAGATTAAAAAAATTAAAAAAAQATTAAAAAAATTAAAGGATTVGAGDGDGNGATLSASQAADATASWYCQPPIVYRPSPIEGTFFCSNYTNYWAACNVGDPNSCSDNFTRNAYADLQRLLALYSCDLYSRIWTCDDCLEAYKRWVCAQSFKMCDADSDICGGVGNPTDPESADPTCVRRICQDVCFDVMRKCPNEIGFGCPALSDQREYAPPGSVCNNLERPPPDSAVRASVGGVAMAVTVLVAAMLLV